MTTEKNAPKLPYTIKVTKMNRLGFPELEDGNALVPLTNAELHLLLRLRESHMTTGGWQNAIEYIEHYTQPRMMEDWAELATLLYILQESEDHECFEPKHARAMLHMREVLKCFAPCEEE